jgi:hypothetical protein
LISTDDWRWVATGKDVNQRVKKHEACAAEIIEWAKMRDLQLDTAQMEAALFTYWRGQKKHLWPILTAKIQVRDGFV